MKKRVAINLGFLLSLVCLAAIAYLSHALFNEFVLHDREEERVFQLTIQLDDLLRGLKDEYGAQRIYLASQSDDDLELYRRAVRKVDDRVTLLRDLARQKPLYRTFISEIVPMIDERHRILEGGIERGVRDPRAKALIREIRDHVSGLKSQALAALKESSRLQQQSIHKIRSLMMAKTLLVALLFSMVFLLLRKDIARRARQEAELIRNRDHLDELVLLRTEELVKANDLLNREMTVRRKAEASLHNLNSHMELIREQERLAISRDIHDEVGQSLTALKLDLAWIGHKFLPGDQEFAGRLKQMGAFLDRLIAKVQNIIADLRPPLLDNLGIVEAVRWQVTEFRRRNAIPCELVVDEKISGVGENAATATLRILMEALTNISRHAAASKAKVSLRAEGEHVILTVSDNGRGITSDAIESPTSYGLMGMMERARLCGGSLSLSGGPEAGTTVLLRVPMREES